MTTSAITLAELSVGPHEVRRHDEQDAYDEHVERARRLDVLQRAESEFEPVPFDAEAARSQDLRTRVRSGDCQRTQTTPPDGRPHDRRHRNHRESSLLTTNPEDFKGLEDLLAVVPVTRPRVPHESR
jgi:hypothetical protein